MEKKVLCSLSLLVFVLAGCSTRDPKTHPTKHPPKAHHIIYKRVYQPPKDAAQDILGVTEDGKHIDSTAVYQEQIGEAYVDTFTKERGRNMSSHFDPADF
jgi:hypothetical protein